MKARLLHGLGWLLFVTGVLLSAGLSWGLTGGTGFGSLSPIERIQVGAITFGGTTYCLSRLLHGHPWRWSLAAINAPVLLFTILFSVSVWVERQWPNSSSPPTRDWFEPETRLG